jgi:hypothetical protein
MLPAGADGGIVGASHGSRCRSWLFDIPGGIQAGAAAGASAVLAAGQTVGEEFGAAAGGMALDAGEDVGEVLVGGGADGGLGQDFIAVPGIPGAGEHAFSKATIARKLSS